jgi:hypothetical protein
MDFVHRLGNLHAVARRENDFREAVRRGTHVRDLLTFSPASASADDQGMFNAWLAHETLNPFAVWAANAGSQGVSATR